MSLLLCRVCLDRNVKLSSIEDHKLLQIFYKLASCELNSEDGMPTTVCYICVSQLRRCRRFFDLVTESTRTLTHLLQNGVETSLDKTSVIMGAQHHFVAKTLHQLSLVDDSDHISDLVGVKEEQVVDENLFNIENSKPDDIIVQESQLDYPEQVVKEEQADKAQLLDIGESCLVKTDMKGATFIKIKHELVLKKEMASDDDSIATEQNRLVATDMGNFEKSHKPSGPGNQKYYCCDLCNMKCDQKCDLIEHLRLHNIRKIFFCKTCKKVFKQAKYLKKHNLRNHSEKKHNCEFCKKTFHTAGNLKKHYIRIHSEKKPYACESCDKAFVNASHLIRHIRSHTGEKPYSCTSCEKSFSASSNLKRHMLVHTGEKPYSCDVCDKSLSNAVNMKRHMLLHNREMPCSCKLCGMAFTHTARLREHMLLHSSEKPFSCNSCDKAFNRAGDLKRHMLVHTGEKPFMCKTCNMAFSQAIHMKQHMLTNKHKDTILGL